MRKVGKVGMNGVDEWRAEEGKTCLARKSAKVKARWMQILRGR